MKIIGDKSIVWFPGFSVGYERENVWGYNFYFEYNVTYNKVADVLSFARITPDSPVIDSWGADLILSLNNIDVGIKDDLTDNLSYAFGPTVTFAGRSFVIDNAPRIPGETLSNNIDDRLVSLCLGVNTYFYFQVPFSSGTSYPFFFSSLKFRYLHSVLFDKRGSNVDNYYQSFLFSQLNLGIGYNF